jgi:hypothetical protein
MTKPYVLAQKFQPVAPLTEDVAQLMNQVYPGWFESFGQLMTLTRSVFTGEPYLVLPGDLMEY